MTVAMEPDSSKRNEKQKGWCSGGGKSNAFLLVRNNTTSAYFTLRKSSYQDFRETPLLLNRLLSE